MKRSLLFLIAIGVFATAFTSRAVAQQTSASLTGTVSDQTGAVIANASVTAVNKGTNASRTVMTDQDGVYLISGLPAGEYRVRVEAPSFKATVLEQVSLNVGQSATSNATLNVGEATAEVTASASEMTELVDTTTSKVNNVIGRREVENLPLNGRNFLELALLTPGNAPAPNFDPTKANTVLISSAGQLGRGANVMIDGTDNNDDVVGGSLVNVSQDAVGEFEVVTNRFSAEAGRSGSSIINVVTRSGTNEHHGSFSFYERDRRLQSNISTTTGPEPDFDRQQYSFTLGGPIIKEKLFYFGAFELRDQDNAVEVGRRDVATRTISREFATAPLRNYLFNTRFDYKASRRDDLTFRYIFEDIAATGQSKLDRSLGSASYLQDLSNRFHAFVGGWSRVISSTKLNDLRFSVNDFSNTTDPLDDSIQLTFPSILDGSSFRVPQATTQNRLQLTDNFTWVAGRHSLKFGGEVQRIHSTLGLGVFRQGRIEFVQDFANQDRNQDGQINDEDLLFAVTLRSAFPDRDLFLPDVDNTHFAFYFQDDWRVTRHLTFNLGLRYQIDTNEKNNSGYDDRNPIVDPFYIGDRTRDTNNFAPRFGFNYAPGSGRFSVHGGYGIYYDRIVLELITLERGLDGRALPVAVRAGNALTDPTGAPIFLDKNGNFQPFAPRLSNPFSGFILPGAGASGINIIANDMQNPMVQQSNLGVQWEFAKDYVFRADYLHNFGTHFIIGRNIGVVDNPVVGGPDRVVNLESSVKTFYDGLLLSVEKRVSRRFGFRAAYTLSKSLNYANDDQIPFSNGPLDSNDLRRELGPAPTDQRHRFTMAGTIFMPYGFRLSPIMTLASGVPMDILLPDASSRLPGIQRNAGGRLFRNAGELNAYINSVNAGGGVNGQLLPLAPANARFSDSFKAVDMRISKVFTFKERFHLEPIVEIFNIFDTTNILGFSNTNYSGFGNVLGSPNFGQPVTTAGGVFGSGGPRAFQLAARFTF